MRKIVVTGADGFLGRHLVTELVSSGYEVKPLDLVNGDLRTSTDLFSDGWGDTLIHCAAAVGGIAYNQLEPISIMRDNLLIGLNTIDRWYESHPFSTKIVLIGTVCSYPCLTSVPFSEKDFWSGYPEETNAPYGIAKKTISVYGNAYRQKHGANVVTALPTNMYGEGDNFGLKSHVIPGLIARIDDCKKAGKDLIVWGDGMATREFIYVKDAARAIKIAAEKYEDETPINIGIGQETSIKELVEIICDVMNFDGNIIWDTTKSNGQPRRSLDTSKLKSLGFSPWFSLTRGIEETVKWYESTKNI